MRIARKYPREPRKVVVSSIHYYDEVVRFWLATCKARGSTIAVYQHGGVFNTTRFIPWQNIDIELYSEWIAWGEILQRLPTKAGYISKISNKDRSRGQLRKRERIVVELSNGPRFLQYGLSQPANQNWNKYFSDIRDFLGRIRSDLAPSVTVRCNRHDFGRDVSTELQTKFPTFSFDDGRTSIRELRFASRLCVITTDGTGLLESLALGIPTLAWWDQHIWEPSETAIPHLRLLESCGVLHTSSESAADCLNLVVEDVECWWQESFRQEAIQEFLRLYARVDVTGGEALARLLYE
jgi:putative transferase (TIGR04331 family)